MQIGDAAKQAVPAEPAAKSKPSPGGLDLPTCLLAVRGAQLPPCDWVPQPCTPCGGEYGNCDSFEPCQGRFRDLLEMVREPYALSMATFCSSSLVDPPAPPRRLALWRVLHVQHHLRAAAPRRHTGLKRCGTHT